MKEVKNPATYDELVKKIKSHGFIVKDEIECKNIIASVGYYRLSAYFLPFKKDDGTYVDNISFERVYNIYEFDRKLRNLIFGAIEVIEVYLRSVLSNFHALQYGSLGYLETSSFNDRHNAEKFNENIQREIDNNSKVLFVKHHIDNYDGMFPLWVVSELFTFGMLSYFYNDLTTADKKQLAGNAYKDVAGWLRCCTDLRNICAHYGRLYYRIFSAMPAGKELEDYEKRRLWGAIFSLKSLYPTAEKWNHEFLPSLKALFEEYKSDIDLYHIAFPQDWEKRITKTTDSVLKI